MQAPTPKTLAYALACGLTCAAWAAEDALDRADIVLGSLAQGLDTHLILGNGDLMAFLEEQDGDLVVGTSKNDVWDVRLETDQDAPLVPISVIEQTALHGADRKPPAEALKELVAKHAGENDCYHRNPYPCPRMTARWKITLPAAIRQARLNLRTATATVELEGGGGLRCIVHALRNVVILEPFGNAQIPTPVLEAILDPGIIPPADTGVDGSQSWLVQKLPDDLDVPGITFAVVGDGTGERCVMAQSVAANGDEAKTAASQLVKEALAEASVNLWAQHRAWWVKYWLQSSVDLADLALEQLWYRQVYFMGAAIRPGAASPGLFAPITSNKPAWHGDYHTNYNIQQTYWSALATNHPDLLEPYVQLIASYLPRARWLAKELYGVDGAFYPHVIMFNEPPPEVCKAVNRRQYVHIEWAYTLGVTAFTVQNLWWRYLYDPDRQYLADTVYPVLRETARFYANVLNKYRGPDGRSRPPTVSPEHWGWTAGLERNRNCAFDTAMMAFILKAAAEAATILGTDEAEANAWRTAIKLLPPYPCHGTDEPLIVDVEGAPPITYNIPIPATVVFPGEQITWASEEDEKAVFARTIAVMQSNGNNDMVINSIARARLGMPDALEYLKREALARLRPNGTLTLNRNTPDQRFNAFGHYTEMYGAAAAVSELLMQSVDGVIRLFPAWPAGRKAAFEKLRAVGGFFVSAEFDGEKVRVARVRCTAAGECRMVSPWPVAEADGKLLTADGRGIIRFEMKPGQVVELRQKKSE